MCSMRSGPYNHVDRTTQHKKWDTIIVMAINNVRDVDCMQTQCSPKFDIKMSTLSNND